MKILLVLIVLLLVVGFAAFLGLPSRLQEPAVSETAVPRSVPPPRGESFEVRIERPRSARPLFGILPAALEAELLDGAESFDHSSPGAEITYVGPDRLEASAAGWKLVLDADEQGRARSASHLVFPFAVGGRRVSLRCDPARHPVGYLHTTRRPDSKRLDGTFLLELTHCENATSGQPVDWPTAPPFGLPASPLTVRGSFAGANP